ncbi:hypothetical protein GCM10028797_25700 [Dyella agri]
MASTHEQLVAECRAKSLERTAYRGLAEKKPLRRARDVAFLHERPEDQKQIEIELTKIMLDDGGHYDK